jgi:hypothetical protein
MSEAEQFARQPFELRGYQREAVASVLTDLQTHRAVVAVMATGAGKTPVAGTFDILKIRWSRNLATVKQARYLRRLGHEKPWRATFQEAREYISGRRS